ncbi:DUF2833 domain-containing protein [bacterium]|nr:DUF2833 domain-containing protein [bacterium]
MQRKQKNARDVKYILKHLRAIDIEEIKAIHGENWFNIVYKSIMETDFEVLIGKKGNKPVCMGGAWAIDKNTKDVGVVWFLTTPEIQKHKVQILREFKKEIKKYDKKYWLLYNFIHEKNYSAKSWLKWLGFKFENPKPFGIKMPEGFEFFYRVKIIEGLA